MSRSTLMAAEIVEIPDMISRQLGSLEVYLETGRQFRRDETRGFVTCARGTSDHAATFFKYLIETRAGVPVASIGPSVASVYNAKLRLDGFTCLTFSQSGGSPDLAALQRSAKNGGAHTIAILNVANSPVGHEADKVLPVFAGPERAVAATKSFVGMLIASLGFIAGYLEDADLLSSLDTLPDLANDALTCDWSSAGMPLARTNSLYCIGRGPSMAIAAEAALKLKETCRLHAEAYSAAELLHGPVVIAGRQLGALIFGASGKAASSTDAAFRRLEEVGALARRVQSGMANATLPVPKTGHELLTPVAQAIAFYKFVENLAVALGENPDAPPGLTKVTETV